VLEKGSSIICFSTVPPSFLATVADRLAALGIGLCDSPVSGGSTRAAAGSLAVMTSGTSESIQAASPVLEALTRQPGGHSIVGDTCGDASSFKLINQVFCAVQIAMASESMAFGAKLGLNPRLLQNTCSQLAGSSFMRMSISVALAVFKYELQQRSRD
jgi:3-hydroxyisobutyrate dehydrogenase-like beta-hydroxyacid dehydrogenase